MDEWGEMQDVFCQLISVSFSTEQTDSLWRYGVPLSHINPNLYISTQGRKTMNTLKRRLHWRLMDSSFESILCFSNFDLGFVRLWFGEPQAHYLTENIIRLWSRTLGLSSANICNKEGARSEEKIKL